MSFIVPSVRVLIWLVVIVLVRFSSGPVLDRGRAAPNPEIAVFLVAEGCLQVIALLGLGFAVDRIATLGGGMLVNAVQSPAEPTKEDRP